MKLYIVEDNPKLRDGLIAGFSAIAGVDVCGAAGDSATAAGEIGELGIDAILMDVELRGSPQNGVQLATSLRREIPRLPVVFYSIADDDNYYRDFLGSGILSHYAYVSKGNFLLPEMILPLLRDAVAGRSFIDPQIEARVQAVRERDESDPLALLEPNEQAVVALLAQGLTNAQIAAQLGLRDARAVARTNGQIYTAWRLNETATDEKVARIRAALIFNQRRLIMWDADGDAMVFDPQGKAIPFTS